MRYSAMVVVGEAVPSFGVRVGVPRKLDDARYIVARQDESGLDRSPGTSVGTSGIVASGSLERLGLGLGERATIGPNEVRMRDSDTASDHGGGYGSGRPTPGMIAVARGVADWLRAVALALVLFLVVRAWVVEAFKIPTGSMEGTLLVGDFLLVNKAVYGTTLPGLGVHIPGFAEPEWGDVVVFHPPHEPTKNYVKRIVGVPRDTLEMRDKKLLRNGVPVDEAYVRYVDRRGDAVHPDMGWQSNHLIASTRRRYHPTRDNWGPIVVPPGRYFVLGDNRDNSEDSRYWGFVERDQIRGKPWRVYYSFEAGSASRFAWLSGIRWGRLGAPIH